MRDLHAVIWTRSTGRPRKLADLDITDTEVRVSYDASAIADRVIGVSLLLPPERFPDTPWVFKRTEALSVPPFVWSRIPLENEDNVHRRVLASIVAARRPPPPPGMETDFEILLLAGRDGIGHLDFFRTDADAEAYYAGRRRRQAAPMVLDDKSGVWRSVGSALGHLENPDETADLGSILAAIGPTPSAGGMIPKFLFAVPDTGEWDGRVAATGVGQVGNERFVDALVKIETGKYPGIVSLEALCYEVHRELGCEVPRFWTRTSPEGLRLLAVERFDRRGGRPMHLESLFSLLNVASANRVLSATGGSYQEVAQVLGLQDPVASSEPAKDRREMFKRFCMALLTGNGDMHGENMAVLVGPRGPRLAPVYDPAPMRAYAQHDMYSALPWMRGDARPGFGLPGDLAERLERLSSTFGVRRSDHISILGLCLEGTADYLDRVDGLQDVPEARKVSLRRAVEPVRYRLQRHYEEMAEPVAAGPTP